MTATTPTIAVPTADGGYVLRPMTFANLIDKANWIDAQASLDATDPEVRDLAVRYAKAYGSNDECAVARKLHDFVRDSVTYVYGPGHQRMYSAKWVLENGYGNCVDKCRLLVALCRSVEIEARILPVFDGDSFYHCQAQIRCPGSEQDPRAEQGGWLRAEVILRGVPLGSGKESAQYDAQGRLVLA